MAVPESGVANGARAAGRILLVDDDPDITATTEVSLALAGFEVHVVNDGHGALSAARTVKPDVVLLDVVMPGMDGHEVCKALRHDPATAQASIIMLTGKSRLNEKVEGLESGADDYIAKPFDPSELIARLNAAIRRSSQLGEVSPLTRLPGNFRIANQLELFCSNATDFALIHADLDNFKAFNDRYGFSRGDDAIRLTAEVLADALRKHESEPSFLGHIGGDDFVIITSPENVEDLAQEIVSSFESRAAHLYDVEDRTRGFIEETDRTNQLRRYPIMSISLGIATSATRKLMSGAHAAEIASEMKRVAKRRARSAFEIDRRRSA